LKPQRGIPIVNQQSKINNQKFFVDHDPRGDGRLGRPSEGESPAPSKKAPRHPAATRFQ
jgi:hypothetical protein